MAWINCSFSAFGEKVFFLKFIWDNRTENGKIFRWKKRIFNFSIAVPKTRKSNILEDKKFVFNILCNKGKHYIIFNSILTRVDSFRLHVPDDLQRLHVVVQTFEYRRSFPENAVSTENILNYFPKDDSFYLNNVCSSSSHNAAWSTVWPGVNTNLKKEEIIMLESNKVECEKSNCPKCANVRIFREKTDKPQSGSFNLEHVPVLHILELARIFFCVISSKFIDRNLKFLFEWERKNETFFQPFFRQPLWRLQECRQRGRYANALWLSNRFLLPEGNSLCQNNSIIIHISFQIYWNTLDHFARTEEEITY